MKQKTGCLNAKLVPVYLHTFRTQYEVLGVEVPHAHIRTHSMHQILPISPFRTYFAHKLHIHLSYYHAPAHKNARESALPSSGPHTHIRTHLQIAFWTTHCSQNPSDIGYLPLQLVATSPLGHAFLSGDPKPAIASLARQLANRNFNIIRQSIAQTLQKKTPNRLHKQKTHSFNPLLKNVFLNKQSPS